MDVRICVFPNGRLHTTTYISKGAQTLLAHPTRISPPTYYVTRPVPTSSRTRISNFLYDVVLLAKILADKGCIKDTLVPSFCEAWKYPYPIAMQTRAIAYVPTRHNWKSNEVLFHLPFPPKRTTKHTHTCNI